MANKTIKNLFDTAPSGALVGTTIYETQLTAGGASQAATHAQLLTFIQNLATAFAQNINIAGNFSVGAGKLIVTAAAGDVFIAGTVNLAGNVSIGSGEITFTAADGSALFAGGIFSITAGGDIANGTAFGFNASGGGTLANGTIVFDSGGDIEITNTIKGFILKSPNGTRYRIKVDDAGNLGTELA